MSETIRTSNLKEFFYNGVSKPVLKEGEYTVKLLKTEFVDHEQNPYVKVTLKDVETGREITTNKFDRGFQIMIAHLKKQLELEDEEIKVQDFLKELIDNETNFNIWVTIYTDAKTQRSNTNINFLKPLEQTTQQIEVVEDEVL